jgi:hypothetical protein
MLPLTMTAYREDAIRALLDTRDPHDPRAHECIRALFVELDAVRETLVLEHMKRVSNAAAAKMVITMLSSALKNGTKWMVQHDEAVAAIRMVLDGDPDEELSGQ